MTFTVKYRAIDGKMREECIEAASRSECVAKCKAQGIAPISVKEGGKVSSAGAQSHGERKTAGNLIWIIAGTIILGGALWWLFGWQNEVTVVPEKPKMVKKIKTKPTQEIKVAITNSQVKASKPTIDMKALTPEERNEIRIAKFEEKGIDLTVPSNRVVATGTEQIMAWIFTTEVGELPPPLPKIPDTEMVHLEKILMSDNAVLEGDSDRVAETKEMLKVVKKEMSEFIKKGGDPKEFLEYYRGELVQAHETRKTVRQSVMKVLKEEPAIALEYLDEVNKELAAKGIKKITLHPKQLKHFGITVEQ